MEGVTIISNNKPLLSSYFDRPQIASLAVDAFLAQKRSRPSPSSSSRIHGTSNSNNKSSVDPVIWFEAIEDIAGPLPSTGSKIGNKRRTPRRRDSYTVTSDEEEEDSSDSSEEDEDEDAQAEWNDAAEPSSLTAISPGNAFACCHITHNNLHFLVPVRRECDPAVAFSYLYSLLSVLRTYINDEISDISLRDNFDIVLQLLSETFNAPYPISTDASALSELVPSTNFALFNKVLSAGLAAASQASAATSGGSGNSTPILSGREGVTPFSSPLHWRRAGIRYAQNEVYFDITEEVKAILDNNGNVITGDIWGRIDCKSRLSGMPDLSVNFSNASMLQDTSFHPCVRLARWSTSKILSFVPPDGQFELMGYRLDSSSQQTSTARRTATSISSASSANLPIPLRIRPVITIGEVGGSFNITVSPPTSFTAGGATKIEDVVVSLRLGENATGLKGSISSPASSASRIQSSTNRGAGDKLPTGGSWEFDTTSHTLIWRIPKLQSNSPTLSGTWLFDESKKSGSSSSRPSPTLDVTFKAPLSNISGLSITNFKVEGERYSMYKALRSHLTGSLEVRW